MRCPTCNKFASFDTDTEPEISDEKFDDDTCVVSFNVRIVNTCAECSEELKEATFDVELDGPKPFPHEDSCKNQETYSVEVESSREDRVVRGKSPRYNKTFYGYSATATVECDGCSASFSISHQDDIQASAMEELA
jgi:hypothetical protein